MASFICEDVAPQRADDFVPAGQMDLERGPIVCTDLCHELPQSQFSRRQVDERPKRRLPETSAAGSRFQRETAIAVAISVMDLCDLRVTETFPRLPIRHDPEGAARLRASTRDPGPDRSIVEAIGGCQEKSLKLGIAPQRSEKAEIVLLR